MTAADVAKLIAQAIDDQRMSYLAAAKLCGVHPHVLTRAAYNGNVRVDALFKVCAGLGIKIYLRKYK